MEYQNKHGKTVKVHPFGVSVNLSTPWVAGSLDGIVYDHTEENNKRKFRGKMPPNL